ncbi:Protein CBR-HPO-33 [Caenorhabditis briggsae]|uniref:Protein CBR-HPO-33 n=1 Tax=Caenorhabditis briggsae TaxID=6238 RepID=A8XXG0_CAEBR|nr:Protein CBR-HPO-33 [Caenorhabditis briggsae]CAP37306.1 Protein CBR-HPO-33 [Caenorhabditis briggsae]
MLILLAYMKVLLLFLYFLPNNVGGCLVVKPKNPDLQNCKCSIDLFNQDDIRNNNGGSYLANQKAWNPIVTATDSCGLSITCDPIAGVSSFMTVMFRSNGNPLYMTGDRGDRTVRCVDHPLDSKVKIWIARGTRVINPAVACVKLEIQKDDVPMNGCQCPPIKHIDALGIIQMDSHTSWLARKLIIRASIAVDSNCEVSFNAALLGPTDFQLMLLRDEAPPIFLPIFVPQMRRYLKDDIKPAKVVLDDLTCRKVGNAYKWDYGSSKITDKTLYMIGVIGILLVITFPKGKIAVKCTTNTRKWTVDKAVDVPTIDVIYAVCVDFR